MRKLYVTAGFLTILLIAGILIGGYSLEQSKQTGVSDKVQLVENDRVHILEHDGFPVAYQNGFPIPAFTTWQLDQLQRSYESLNGEWSFFHDADGSYEENAEPAELNFDDSSWSLESVPASLDYAYQNGEYSQKFGSFWFRKVMIVDEDWQDKFIKLVSLGVGPKSEIFVNGYSIGTTDFGMTPFAINITPFLEIGKENTIAIRVDRKPHGYIDRDSVPSGSFDWWDYSGITRDIFLEATTPQTVLKVNVQASELEKRVQMQAVVLNLTESTDQIEVRMDPGIAGIQPEIKEVEMGANEVKVVSFEFDAPTMESWTPDSPRLYTATAEIPEKDVLTAQYGAIDVKVESTDLIINEEPVFLKGTNWHEESVLSGRSLTTTEYQQELDLMKEANANFIRQAHYNRHPYAYQYADEIGLYIMDEIENYWMDVESIQHQLKEGTISEELAIAMAWNQSNHPSVIMWSVGNENTSNNQEHVEFFNMLRDAVNQIDQKERPITYASNTQHHPEDITRVETDLLTINQYYGFHGGNPEDFGASDFEERLEILHELYPDKPIIITENGTWSMYGNRGNATEGGTEDWQAANFAAHWDVTVSKPYTAGYTFWNFKDYRSKEQYTEEEPSRLSTMGMVDWYELGQKVVYEYFQYATNNGTNRVLNPNFESGTDEWSIYRSSAGIKVASGAGLTTELDSGQSFHISQRTGDLLEGDYEFAVTLEGVSEDTNVRLEVEAKNMDKVFSVEVNENGRFKVPFHLSHDGSAVAQFTIYLESEKDAQTIIIRDVNVSRVWPN
ncbi:glycoside hydrolase family 2 TIM barrel-domain containing protein [Gracilibacillus sp. S3-1-1]|uniref:Glycoside hydrolase family 2 TIM barrel-domain containing protein n=1 Tax=Gracilibacillus pellucidus TaxID=3095368 RepID=A0ACC6M2X4_9BACI|nr:glycoside hydrolase family 2 TIM barrel-domain containing protein [Gracilibacillus sp. S3-1-1]MDX8045306.1 glycoside hydrolase family 2 TIM barrel-domain containing protein [Gracilibacillus sp. S3-1-1]